jgi:hypothetical protein
MDYIAMSNCNWEEIHGFSSKSEYDRFQVWLDSQIAEGMVASVPVTAPGKGLIFGLSERWFQCLGTGQIWRLVAPEFPFKGLWEPTTT